jgi:hypothetical protein
MRSKKRKERRQNIPSLVGLCSKPKVIDRERWLMILQQMQAGSMQLCIVSKERLKLRRLYSAFSLFRQNSKTIEWH